MQTTCGSSGVSPAVRLLDDGAEKGDFVTEIINLLDESTVQAICNYQKRKQGIGQLSLKPCSDLVRFRIVMILADFSFNVGVPETQGVQFFADKFSENPRYPDCQATE